MHRTQIYIPEDQTARLDKRAVAEGVSRSTVIRRAVDEYLARDERDSAAWHVAWAQAVRRTAGIATYLPDGAGYVETLREADASRLRGMEP